MASNFSDEQMKNEALQTFADKVSDLIETNTPMYAYRSGLSSMLPTVSSKDLMICTPAPR